MLFKNLKKKIQAAVVLLVVAAVSTSALAHSGKTNKKGCHKESRTKTYHCH